MTRTFRKTNRPYNYTAKVIQRFLETRTTEFTASEIKGLDRNAANSALYRMSRQPDSPIRVIRAKASAPTVYGRADCFPDYPAFVQKRKCPEHIDAGLNYLLLTRAPGQTFSFEEIGQACGLSHEGVRLIQDKALKKLRAHFTREEYEALLQMFASLHHRAFESAHPMDDSVRFLSV